MVAENVGEIHVNCTVAMYCLILVLLLTCCNAPHRHCPRLTTTTGSLGYYGVLTVGTE